MKPNDLQPGEYVLLLVRPTEVDRVGIEARRVGLEMRDSLSILSPDSRLCGLLLRVPPESSTSEHTVRDGLGTLDIDSARISTTDTLDGGDTSNGKRSELYGDRPWMHDDEVLEARKIEAVGRVEKAESMGRWPSNVLLVHGPRCVCLGIKKVKNNDSRDGSITDTPARSWKNTSNKGIARVGHGNTDGTESVADWMCQSDCPVRLLDIQSGVNKSPSSYVRSSTNKNVNAYGDGIGENEGDLSLNYGDEGGASRFFHQTKTLDELESYLSALIRGGPVEMKDDKNRE